MFHSPECQKYRQWKREQDRKLKGKKPKDAKKKRNEPIADCMEDDEEKVTDATLKIDSPKCKKKKKRIRPRLGPGSKYVLKRVSLTELLLKKIQPSVEVREQFFNHRHIPCLYHTALDSDDALGSEESARMSLLKHIRAQRYPSRRCKEKKQAKKKRMKGGKKAQGAKKKKDSETGEEVKDETLTTSKSKQEVTDQPKRKKVKRRMVRRKKTSYSDSESEDSECESICSFDSEVCLAGLKLTAQDKRKLKQLKRQSQVSNAEEQN